MPIQEIALTDQEKQVVAEVQQALGFATIEETIVSSSVKMTL